MEIIFSEDLDRYQIYNEIPKTNLSLYGFVYRHINKALYINLILQDERKNKILPIFLTKIEDNMMVLPSILKNQKPFILKSIFEEVYRYIISKGEENDTVIKKEFWEVKEVEDFLRNTNPHRSAFFFEVMCSGCMNHPLISIYYYNEIIDKFLYKFKDKKLKILDMGCGLGIGSFVLAKNKNFDVVAVDNNQYLMPLIEKMNVGFENLRFMTEIPREQFDVVISLETLEHNENPEVLLQEIVKLIKEGGMGVLSVPNWLYHGIDLNSDHRVNFTPEKFKKLLERNKNIQNIEIFADVVHDLNPNPVVDFEIEKIDGLRASEINHIYARFEKRETFTTNIISKKKPKNILFVNHSVPPYEYTGTPLSTYYQMKGLSEIGYNTAVLIPHESVKNNFKYEEAGGVKIYKVPKLSQLYHFLNDLYLQYEIRNYMNIINEVIEDFKPDIVHINDYVFMTTKIMELFEASGIKMVKQVRNMEEICYWGDVSVGRHLGCYGPEDSFVCAECVLSKEPEMNHIFKIRKKNEIAGKIRARLEYMNYIYSLFDVVVFSNTQWKDYYKKFIKVKEERTHIVPIGFNFDTIKRPKDIREVNNPINTVYIGTLSERKGLELLMNIFSDKNVLSKDFILSIYGDAYNNVNKIEELEKVSHGKVRYMGKYNGQADLEKILSSADIGIFPSYFETYGRVVREYIYFGVPVISSNVFGVKGFIEEGKNGFICDKTDLQCFKERLIYLLNNPYKIKQLKEGCLKTAIPDLHEEIKSLDELYIDVFNR